MKRFLIPMFHALFVFVSIMGKSWAQYDDVELSNRIREEIARGNLVKALNELEAEATTAEKANQWGRASFLYARASGTARIGGQLQKGFLYAQKAYDAAQKSKDPWLQSIAIRRSVEILQRLGKHSEAREWILKGFDNVNQIRTGERRNGAEATFYGFLGIDFLRANELSKAIEHLSIAVLKWESIVASEKRRGSNQYASRSLNVQVRFMLRLGDAYQQAKMFEDAIRTYEKSLTIINANSSQSFRAGGVYRNLGRLFLVQNDSIRAEEYLQKAFESASKLQISAELVSAGIELGNLSLQRDKASEAIEYYRKAIASIESSRSQLETEELRKSFFDNQGKAYVGIIRASLIASKPHEAFDYNERARSRAFLDILGTKVQLSHSGSLGTEEQSLRARIATLSERIDTQHDEEDEQPADRGQLRGELAAAQKAYDDFLIKVRKDNNEQASLMNVEPLKLTRVQELLDPGVTMLEYFVTQDAVLLWVIDKDRTASVNVPLPRGQLRSRVGAFREAIQQFEEKDKFKQQSEELYKTLIETALPHIKGKELIIVPHDVLHYLPFQVLLSPQGKYLIEDFPISYLSSASLMQFTQEKRKAKGELTSVIAQSGKLLTFGNPDLGDPKMTLQFAEIEAKEIKSLYPQSSVYLEKEATEEKAKSLSPQNDIIHFATHAELKADDPLASAILLAKSEDEDGRLEVREIFGMDLKASLIVLSACETGLGKLSSGDELVGLTRAFIYAGTPSVVASLWNVEDSSTAQLMASFYKNLKTMTKVEALRQAQLQLIRGEGRSDLLSRRGVGGVGRLGEVAHIKTDSSGSVSTSHPYFWAPFILVGEGK